MTVAVCIKCGAIKHGALNPCNECRLRPETETEVAYSLSLSDHHRSIDTLEATSRTVRLGGSLPVLTREWEQRFIAAIKDPLQDFSSLLQLSSGDKQPKFIFDHSRLLIDRRQPAPYPDPSYLCEFVDLDKARGNGTDSSARENNTTRVNLIFQMPSDEFEFILKNVEWELVRSALAMTRFTPLRTIVCHLNFTIPPEGSLQAITIHESMHIYRAAGLFHESEWSRLLRLARQLGVFQLSIGDFLLKTKWIGENDICHSVTLEKFYKHEYRGRELFQELLEQEEVAHLVEFSRRGFYTTGDLAPVQDILDAISSTQVAGRLSIMNVSSLLGTLSRVERL